MYCDDIFSLVDFLNDKLEIYHIKTHAITATYNITLISCTFTFGHEESCHFYIFEKTGNNLEILKDLFRHSLFFKNYSFAINHFMERWKNFDFDRELVLLFILFVAYFEMIPELESLDFYPNRYRSNLNTIKDIIRVKYSRLEDKLKFS